MARPTDIHLVAARLHFIPIQARIPLKFGTETVTSVTCARACVGVADRQGRTAEGWGETPLSVQWVWPSKLPYEPRHDALKESCRRLAEAWVKFEAVGHPIEIGHDFQHRVLPRWLREMNGTRPGSTPDLLPRSEIDGAPPSATRQRRVLPKPGEPVPWLAALVCCSVFDQAIHDAYGNLHGRPTYETYGPEFMSRDLTQFLEPAEDATISFKNQWPQDFLRPSRADKLRAWHL